METSLIEQMNVLRYNLLKWCTIGWGIWFGTFILKDLINSPIIICAATFIGLIGWAIFSINLIKIQRLRRKIRSDNKLVNALNDELYRFNVSKSNSIGFAVILVVTGLIFGLSQFVVLSAKLVTEVILYFGVLAALISGLIYNRN